MNGMRDPLHNGDASAGGDEDEAKAPPRPARCIRQMHIATVHVACGALQPNRNRSHASDKSCLLLLIPEEGRERNALSTSCQRHLLRG